jgi:hypothetical protein
VDAYAQTINTIAGNGTFGFSGDGGPATAAEFYYPAGAADDPGANIYIPDEGNIRVRAILNSGAAVYPSANPLAFGSQPQGIASAPMILTFTATGATQLNITGLMLNGANAADFRLVAGGTCSATLPVTFPISLNPGSSCTVEYTFTPSTMNAELATLLVSDNAPYSPQPIQLTGTGGPVPTFSPSPNPLTFGNVTLGSTSTAQTLTLSNGGNAALMITGGLTPTGGNAADFALVAGAGTCGSLPITVNPGPGCTVEYTFKPSLMGSEMTTLVLTDNAAVNPTVMLSGTGTVPTVTFTPTAAVGVNFGAVAPGMTSGVMTVTVAVAAGTGNLQLYFIRAFSASDTNDFAINFETSTCPTDGGMVAAGTSCVVNLTYTASFAGTEHGTLEVSGVDLTGSPVDIPLVGTGASTAAGFMLTATSTNGGNGSTVTMLPGDTATFTIVVQPNPGFIGMISLMCASGIPATIATASPTTINVTTTPSPPIPVTCTLQTNCTAALVGPRAPWNRPGPWTAPPLAGVLLLAVALVFAGVLADHAVALQKAGRVAVLIAIHWRRRGPAGERTLARNLAPACGMLLLALLMLTWAGCVNNPKPILPGAGTTPAGVYQIQLIGTAAGGVKTVLTLTVHVI